MYLWATCPCSPTDSGLDHCWSFCVLLDENTCECQKYTVTRCFSWTCTIDGRSKDETMFSANVPASYRNVLDNGFTKLAVDCMWSQCAAGAAHVRSSQRIPDPTRVLSQASSRKCTQEPGEPRSYQVRARSIFLASKETQKLNCSCRNTKGNGVWFRMWKQLLNTLLDLVPPRPAAHVLRRRPKFTLTGQCSEKQRDQVLPIWYLLSTRGVYRYIWSSCLQFIKMMDLKSLINNFAARCDF